MAQFLVTNGLLGDAGQLLVGGLDFGVVVAVPTVDLLTAVVDTLHGTAALETDFGRSSWVWIDEAPQGEPLPVAVITEVGETIDYESRGAGIYRVALREVQLGVFSTSRSEAIRLSRDCVAAIEDGTHENEDGDVMRARLANQLTQMDAEKDAATGRDVWARIVTIQFHLDQER